jgi:hypothetical protein
MAVYARRRYGVTTIGTVIRVIGAVIVLIIALYMLFELFHANRGNDFVQLISNWAGALALWWRNLFSTGNGTLDLFLNFGLAIVFWLVVTGLLARVIDRA